jgi:NAD+ synthase (glutamine-hydrolysing)
MPSDVVDAVLVVFREGVKPQNDEDDMGMTYQELGIYGNLRKIIRCGPVAMFRHCCQIWRDQHSPAVVAAKARHTDSVTAGSAADVS